LKWEKFTSFNQVVYKSCTWAGFYTIKKRSDQDVEVGLNRYHVLGCFHENFSFNADSLQDSKATAQRHWNKLIRGSLTRCKLTI